MERIEMSEWKLETRHERFENPEAKNPEDRLDEWDEKYWSKDYGNGVTGMIETMLALYDEAGERIFEGKECRKILQMTVDVNRDYYLMESNTAGFGISGYVTVSKGSKSVAIKGDGIITGTGSFPQSEKFNIGISWSEEITNHETPEDLEKAKKMCDRAALVIGGIQ